MVSTQRSLQNQLISQPDLFVALNMSELLQSAISVCLYHACGATLVCLFLLILGNCLFNVSERGGNL